MSGTPDRGQQGRFERVRRTPASPLRRESARERFVECLDEIDAYLAIATSSGREGFTPRTGEYAAGSIAMVRTAALFEVSDFEEFLVGTPEVARKGIIHSRNIAGHAGYQQMDDGILWTTLTINLPALVRRWRGR